jgi:hypothetical protein
MDEIDDKQLHELYEAYFNMTDDFIVAEYSPLAVAGVMVAQALTIYKTVLSPADYNHIMGKIFESRDQVKKLTKPALH